MRDKLSVPPPENITFMGDEAECARLFPLARQMVRRAWSTGQQVCQMQLDADTYIRAELTNGMARVFIRAGGDLLYDIFAVLNLERTLGAPRRYFYDIWRKNNQANLVRLFESAKPFKDLGNWIRFSVTSTHRIATYISGQHGSITDSRFVFYRGAAYVMPVNADIIAVNVTEESVGGAIEEVVYVAMYRANTLVSTEFFVYKFIAEPPRKGHTYLIGDNPSAYHEEPWDFTINRAPVSAQTAAFNGNCSILKTRGGPRLRDNTGSNITVFFSDNTIKIPYITDCELPTNNGVLSITETQYTVPAIPTTPLPVKGGRKIGRIPPLITALASRHVPTEGPPEVLKSVPLADYAGILTFEPQTQEELLAEIASNYSSPNNPEPVAELVSVVQDYGDEIFITAHKNVNAKNPEGLSEEYNDPLFPRETINWRIIKVNIYKSAGGDLLTTADVRVNDRHYIFAQETSVGGGNPQNGSHYAVPSGGIPIAVYMDPNDGVIKDVILDQVEPDVYSYTLGPTIQRTTSWNNPALYPWPFDSISTVDGKVYFNQFRVPNPIIWPSLLDTYPELANFPDGDTYDIHDGFTQNPMQPGRLQLFANGVALTPPMLKPIGNNGYISGVINPQLMAAAVHVFEVSGESGEIQVNRGYFAHGGEITFPSASLVAFPMILPVSDISGAFIEAISVGYNFNDFADRTYVYSNTGQSWYLNAYATPYIGSAIEPSIFGAING